MSKRKSNKKRAVKNLGDVTLNDFANSVVPNNRLKKSNNNVKSVISVLKTEVEVEEKSWDEKDEEYDGEFVEEISEDGTVSYVLKKTESRTRRKTVSSSESDLNVTASGRLYPIDIWFILSDYIKPEDIGRFSGICRGSYDVVNTARFWYNLYRRYYKSGTALPENLQPDYLFRKYGLRTTVIRALQYMYPPYIERLKSTAFDEHPDILKRRHCVLAWYKKLKHNWLYYFKLKEKNDFVVRRRTQNDRPDLLEILDDITVNPDDKCRVLFVTCTNFVQMPPVMGLTLSSVTMTLSQGFRHHRLQIDFNSGINATKKVADESARSIILDPVINYKILDWWHPTYPHNHILDSLLNQD